MLVLTQANIRRLVPLTVLPPASHAVGHAAHSTQTDEAQADTVAHLVEVSGILRCECEGRDDAPDIAKSNDPARTNSSPVMAAQVHGEPTDNDWHGRIGARCDQEQSTVHGAAIEVDVQKHSEAGD